MLLKRFNLAANGTTVRRECLAGLTTFLAMVYILFVNSSILEAAGIDIRSAFVATGLVSALASILVGLFSNYPLAAAPGLPLATYFSFYVVKTLGYSWQMALGAVFFAGLIFLFLSVTRIRGFILRSIPRTLIIGTASGLGVFITLIGLKSANIIVSSPNTLVKLGHLATIPSLLFFIGFFVIAILDLFKITGAILIGMLIVTGLSLLLGLNHFTGLFALPSHLSTWNALEFKGLMTQQGVFVIFVFLLITLFDSTGTLVGMLHQLKLVDSHAERRIGGALLADSVSTIAAAMLGTSSICVFSESATGVLAGGRTGLTAVVTGILFIFAIFFAPLAKTIPESATAPALFFVGMLLIKPIAEIEWDDLTESIPGLATFLLIPLSFSIADGLGLGIILYVVLKVVSGKFKQINPLLILLAIFFIFHFATSV